MERTRGGQEMKRPKEGGDKMSDLEGPGIHMRFPTTAQQVQTVDELLEVGPLHRKCKIQLMNWRTRRLGTTFTFSAITANLTRSKLDRYSRRKHVDLH